MNKYVNNHTKSHSLSVAQPPLLNQTKLNQPLKKTSDNTITARMTINFLPLLRFSHDPNLGISLIAATNPTLENTTAI
jgi:hypothetical protein